MPYEKGLAPGRPIGALNKRSVDFMRVLEAHDFCPAGALIECYREAKKTYDNYGTIYDAIVEAREAANDRDGSFAAPPEDNAHKYLKIAGDFAAQLASYSYPKLKAVDPRKATANMTAQEQLEAARMIVKMLEQEVGNGPGNI